jgi:hypothetical protein
MRLQAAVGPKSNPTSSVRLHIRQRFNHLPMIVQARQDEKREGPNLGRDAFITVNEKLIERAKKFIQAGK